MHPTDEAALLAIIVICTILTLYNLFLNPFRDPAYREKWEAEKKAAERRMKRKRKKDDDDELVEDALIMEITGAMDDEEEE